MIDHLEILGTSPNGVELSGQLPQGIGFDSNHQCMYADISLRYLIGLALENPAKQKKS